MKRHHFSLVEILLALGVIAIGICSVMVLFPVGAAATRDASVETYVANAADQMLHMVKYNLFQEDASEEEYWYTYICEKSSPYPGRGIYSATQPSLNSITSAIVGNNAKWVRTSDKALISGTTMESGIFAYADDATQKIYQIVIHRDDQDKVLNDIAEDKIDFRALAVVWADKVRVPVTETTDQELPLNMAARLNVRLEWPAELPAEARQSALYTLEIFHNAD